MPSVAMFPQRRKAHESVVLQVCKARAQAALEHLERPDVCRADGLALLAAMLLSTYHEGRRAAQETR